MAKIKTKEVTTAQKKHCGVWLEAKKHLDMAKEYEKEARKNVIESCFKDEKTVEGVTALNMGNGWQVKFKNPFTISVNDSKVTPAFLKKLPAKIRKAIFIEKLSLDKKVYKKLSAAEKKIVDKALTSKAGSSSIEVVPPKDEE